MTEAKIKLTFEYADSDTRTVEIGPFKSNAAAIIQAKTNIKAFDVTPIASLFLSDNGASCTGIADASIVVTDEHEINLKD